MAEATTDPNELVRLRVTGLNIEAGEAGDELVATLKAPKDAVQHLSGWGFKVYTELETVRVRVPTGVEVRLGDEFAFVRLPPGDGEDKRSD